MFILPCFERLLDHRVVLADEGVQILEICHPSRCPLRDLALDATLHVLELSEGNIELQPHAADLLLQGAQIAKESRRLLLDEHQVAHMEFRLLLVKGRDHLGQAPHHLGHRSLLRPLLLSAKIRAKPVETPRWSCGGPGRGRDPGLMHLPNRGSAA